MDKEIIDKLNAICRNLDIDYNINSGGCCFTAAILAQNLERYHIPYEVMVINDYDFDDFEYLHYCIDNRYDDYCVGLNCDVFAHYYICVDNMDINIDHFDDGVSLGYLSSDDLFWIYNNGEWNPSFDETFCEDIADCITQFFDETFSKKK